MKHTRFYLPKKSFIGETGQMKRIDERNRKLYN